jgi:hypothetical protein
MNYRSVTVSLFLLTVGCGGAPFTLESMDQAVETDAGHIVTVTDPPTASVSVDGGSPTEESQVALEDDAAPDGAPDTGLDSQGLACDAGAPTAITCASPYVGQIPFSTVTQYCVVNGFLDAGNPVMSTVLSVPPECACDYSCTCIMAHTVNLCPQGGVFYQCIDSKTGLAHPDPQGGVFIACEQGDGP